MCVCIYIQFKDQIHPMSEKNNQNNFRKRGTIRNVNFDIMKYGLRRRNEYLQCKPNLILVLSKIIQIYRIYPKCI